MKINIEVLETKNIFSIEGEVDSFTFSYFLKELELLENISGRQIIIDLSFIKSINCRGLLALSKKTIEAEKRGENFEFICTDKDIIETLTLFTHPMSLSVSSDLEDILE